MQHTHGPSKLSNLILSCTYSYSLFFIPFLLYLPHLSHIIQLQSIRNLTTPKYSVIKIVATHGRRERSKQEQNKKTEILKYRHRHSAIYTDRQSERQTES